MLVYFSKLQMLVRYQMEAAVISVWQRLLATIVFVLLV